MLGYARGLSAVLMTVALAACGGGVSDSSLQASKAEHQFACNGLTPGYWCGGASVLLGYKDDTAFCSGFIPGGGAGAGLPAGCGEDVCKLLGFENCDDLCDCFGAADAGQQSLAEACNAGGGMSDVLAKFWAALQLSFPGVMNGGGIECVDEFGNAACGGGFPDCNSVEIETLIGYGNDPAWRDEQEVVKNCIDDILNDGGICVSRF